MCLFYSTLQVIIEKMIGVLPFQLDASKNIQLQTYISIEECITKATGTC
jgi:hypothetical protein